MGPKKQQNGNLPSSKACPIPSGSKKGMKRGRGQDLQAKENVDPLEVTRTLPEGRLSLLPRIDPSANLKLQLFPVDQVTRMGLEKDGHNPYLELTLRARKKISSVLKHIQDKWGGSSIAVGDLTLFPYNRQEKPAGEYRWTTNDLNITAGEVYATIGSPALFRMRYGWFSNPVTKSSGQPHTSEDASVFPLSNSADAGQQLKDMQKLGSCSDMINLCHNCEGAQVPNEELKPVDTSEDPPVANTILPDHAANLVDSKENTDRAREQSAALWSDSLLNISIGGLFSEASIQGILNNSTSKAAAQPSSIICDSFEAFIAANINRPQGQTVFSNGPSSSIFDAEETCHAFPIRNSLSKGFPSSSGKVGFGLCNQSDPKPTKFPKTNERVVDDNGVQIQSVASQDDAHQESETDLLLCSRIYNDERSLGLAGISWTDTLGPFDLGLPSRKIVRGDSISISSLAR